MVVETAVVEPAVELLVDARGRAPGSGSERTTRRGSGPPSAVAALEHVLDLLRVGARVEVRRRP